MGEAKRKKQLPLGDIHNRIRALAKDLAQRPVPGVSSTEGSPELTELIHTAAEAVVACVPASFEFHGRRYGLRCELLVKMEIFGAVGDDHPLLRGFAVPGVREGYESVH